MTAILLAILQPLAFALFGVALGRATQWLLDGQLAEAVRKVVDWHDERLWLALQCRRVGVAPYWWETNGDRLRRIDNSAARWCP